MRRRRGRVFILLASGLLFLGLLNTGVSFLALKRLEAKAGAPIQGFFLPHLFQPVFTLRDVRFDWQGRFQVVSGRVAVRYYPFFLFPGARLRTQIVGEDLEVKLTHEFAQAQGISNVSVDRVEADLVFSRDPTPEIFLFDVRSPQIQLYLKKETD